MSSSDATWEAALTVTHLGRRCQLPVDVGVTGLHRVLGRLDPLRRARAVVVVTGMDGALPSEVSGLVSAPVLAVPTSVGYGASSAGSPRYGRCSMPAAGVAVVNIDNAAAPVTSPPRSPPPTSSPGSPSRRTRPPEIAGLPSALAQWAQQGTR
jgi:NCAIR mutase (PurE)-related protein